MDAQYRIDADAGVIYGKRGAPIRKKDGAGYLYVNSSPRYIGLVHRMIWESVHGPIPSGMQVNHVNGIKTDNRIANLELVTPSGNVRHAYRTGLMKSGPGKGRFLPKKGLDRLIKGRLRHA